jgi:phosphatidylglycerol---prolipoprotein diacylglyceryl transferase
MIPYLFHIYGPLYANCYGLSILAGILILIYLSKKDTILKKIITSDQLINTIIVGTLIGIIGGMLLWGIINWTTLNSWKEIFEIWNGGFSILGSVSAISIFMPIYLKLQKTPIVNFLDRISIYTPLTQSIARIGCFFAGCCYGIETQSIFGIIYSHPDSGAPLFIKIHPTQLYSSALLFLIFLLMYFVLQRIFKKSGQLFTSYLFLISIERFLIDFIRADREFTSITQLKFLSINQWIALILAGISLILFIFYSFKKNTGKNL